MEQLPQKNIDAHVKVYYQIMSPHGEQEIMKIFEAFSPCNRTFSSLELTLSDPDADFAYLVEALYPHIDKSKDSVILLFSSEGEEHVYDLGVSMKIEYS